MSDSFSLLAQRQSSSVRDLIEVLRRIIRANLPGYREMVAGNAIMYGRKGVIISIIPQKSHANVQFSQGVRLADPGGLLTPGSGQMRQVIVRNAAVAGSQSFAQLVRDARALDTQG